MQSALKLTVTIPESRTVELKLPDEVPSGPAEVIVLLVQKQPKERYPQDNLRGSVEIVGDIMEPVLPALEWRIAYRWADLSGGHQPLGDRNAL